MMNTLRLILVGSIFLTACTQSKLPGNPLEYFPGNPTPLAGKVINTDKEILFGASIRIVSDSILAIDNMKDETLLSLVNLKTGKVLRQMIKHGRGPGEMSMLRFCENVHKDSLWVFDPNLMSLYTVNIRLAVSAPDYVIEKLASFNQHRPIVIFKLGTYYIGTLNGLNKRFSLYDHHGNYIKSCLQYPKPAEYADMPDGVFATGFQGVYSIHPGNKRFVFATPSSGNINIFELTGDSISMTVNLPFYPPQMKRDKWVCVHDRNKYKSGFNDIDSNENYIYVIYSGKIMGQFLNDYFVCDHLLVFDWNGRPVKKYDLDIPLVSFRLNAAGDKIYGIAHHPETMIVQYDLK